MERQEVYRLIENHYRINSRRRVKSYTYILKSKENAEDIIQEAYARACKYWKAFEFFYDERCDNEECSFDRWFYRIVKNVIKDKTKENINQGMAVDVEKIPKVYLNAGYYKKYVEEIEELIDSYPPHTSYILRLAFLQQFKPIEITKIVPETNLAISKIIQRFREELKVIYGGV